LSNHGNGFRRAVHIDVGDDAACAERGQRNRAGPSDTRSTADHQRDAPSSLNMSR
jgi:hypothetical protein